MAPSYDPRPWNGNGQPGNCYYCGKKLKQTAYGYDPEKRGYAGTGKFCTLDCGFRYGSVCIDKKDIYITQKGFEPEEIR